MRKSNSFDFLFPAKGDLQLKPNFISTMRPKYTITVWGVPRVALFFGLVSLGIVK